MGLSGFPRPIALEGFIEIAENAIDLRYIGQRKGIDWAKSCMVAVPTSVFFIEVAMFGRGVMKLIQYVELGLGIIECITGITALIMVHSERR